MFQLLDLHMFYSVCFDDPTLNIIDGYLKLYWTINHVHFYQLDNDI